MEPLPGSTHFQSVRQLLATTLPPSCHQNFESFVPSVALFPTADRANV